MFLTSFSEFIENNPGVAIVIVTQMVLTIAWLVRQEMRVKTHDEEIKEIKKRQEEHRKHPTLHVNEPYIATWRARIEKLESIVEKKL